MPNHCDWNLFSVCFNYPSNRFTTLDALSIDLMDKTWNEIQELDKLSKIN